MSEPSKEAWDRARALALSELAWPRLAGQDITWLAVGLQKLMDERDHAKQHAAECYEVATNACARRDELDLRCSRQRTRAEAAEADAKLAWRRVTDLQTRCTELVLERRAAVEKLRELLAQHKAKP